MRASALLFVAMLMTAPVAARQARGPETAPATSPDPAPASASQPAKPADLPVSLDRIREALERPPLFPVQAPINQPLFRVDVQQRNRLQDILSTLNFSSGPRPAGGLYAAEAQRVMFPSVSNPLRQPYAAFSQSELLTIIIENLAGRYLADKLVGAVTANDRAAAEAAARDELRRTIAEYCAGQPNQGAAITICTNPPPELPTAPR
jgi:hypothetical protein